MMRPHYISAGFAVLLFTSCSSLAPFAENECGNRILEETEDCDGASPIAGAVCGAPDAPNGQACTFICVPPATCPEGWVCGLDQRCRKPNGFSPKPEAPIDLFAQQLNVADFDGDLSLDIIGVRENRIKVRFGEPDGEFEEQVSLNSARTVGPLSYADFDQDGNADIIVPVRTGVHMFLGSGDRELAPAIYQPIKLDDREARILALESVREAAGHELLIMQDSLMAFQAVEQRMLEPNTATPLPLGKSASQVLGEVPTADLGNEDGREEFALTFAGATRVWIYTSTGSFSRRDLKVVVHSTVELPPGTMSVERVIFADINGDGFEDLVVPTTDTRQEQEGLAVAYWSPQTNGFSQSCMIELPLAQTGQSVRSLPALLTLADLNSDQRADLITAQGIWLNPLQSTQPVCGRFPRAPAVAYLSAPDEWSEARAGDFNGDTHLDLALAKSSAREILLLLGTGEGVFNPVEIETLDFATQLQLGDFDGDFVHDIAFVQKSDSSSWSSVNVLFGQDSHDDFEARSMGLFPNVNTMLPLLMAENGPSFDGISDLIVTSTSASTETEDSTLAMAVMYGNSERQLLSPLLLRARLASETESGVDNPRAALVGDFCHYCSSDDGTECFAAPDLAVVARSVMGGPLSGGSMTTPLQSEPYLWVFSGHRATNAPTELDFSEGAFRRTLISPPRPFDFNSSCWGQADLDGDGHQELIGLDNAFACSQGSPARVPPSSLLVVDASTAQNTCNATLDYLAADLPSSFRNPSVFRLADLDGDGDQDVVIGFAGIESDPEFSNSGVVVMWNSDGEFVSSESTTLPESQAVRDVGILKTGPNGLPEIVVVSRATSSRSGTLQKPYGLLLYTFDQSAGTYLPPVQLAETRLGDQLVTGDLNGNGLEDIAWTEGDALRILYAQEGQNKP